MRLIVTSDDSKVKNTGLTSSLLILARLFLRLGLTAFGGPAAHIAMMQNEVVKRRGWMTEEEFLDLLSACNLIPGPNSTELAIHIGYRQGGWPGLIVAGLCFILPAVLMVFGIAYAYVRFSQLPAVGHVLDGIKPIIVAIIVQALWSLSKSALKSKFHSLLGLAVLIGCFCTGNEFALLLCGGIFSLLWAARPQPVQLGRPRVLLGTLLALFVLAGVAIFLGESNVNPTSGQSVPYSTGSLFWYFVKIGSVLYGSGYVLLAFLRADLVEHWHWLTPAQLLDAAAVGQVTPGPVFTTATFIGYLLGSMPGAIVATIGIFLPAFFFVAITGPFVHRLRKSKIAAATLDGINVASLALMAFVTIELAKYSLHRPIFIVEAAFAAFILWKFNINPTWLILLGGIVGWMVN